MGSNPGVTFLAKELLPIELGGGMCIKPPVLTEHLPAPGHAGLLSSSWMQFPLRGWLQCPSSVSSLGMEVLILPQRELPKGSPMTPSSPCSGILLQPHFPVCETPWLFWRKLNLPDPLTTAQLCHSLSLTFSSVLSLRGPFAPQTAFADEEQPSEQADYKFIK